MTNEVVYRVIGVRPEGTRVMLCEGLTLARAESVRKTLARSVAFREVLVEIDSSPADAAV